ncbi:MAG: response regulator [Desulfobacterales bacterium]|nr:response regulator [Desulfobacterales bacterium]
MKILIIEDVRTERAILKHWLEELICEVIEASNGVEGLAFYHDQLPELVITDLVMPEKEGIETMISLWQDYPDVKIFVISGAGLKESGEYLPLAKSIGALRTFAKPIDKAELLAAVMDFFPETNPNVTP